MVCKLLLIDLGDLVDLYNGGQPWFSSSVGPFVGDDQIC